MKLDFSEVQEFVPVPAGRYLAEIVKSTSGLSKRAGEGKWTMAFEVREDPGHNGEFVGKTIKWDISLLKNARWKVLQTLQALGKEVSKEDADFDFSAEDYQGNLCVIVVIEEQDPVYGKRSRVQSLASADALKVGVAA